MYKLVIVTNCYAGDFDNDLYEKCFTGTHKYGVCSYKSVIDNAMFVNYEKKPSKNSIEKVLVKLNQFCKETGLIVNHVLLLDTAKNVIASYLS